MDGELKARIGGMVMRLAEQEQRRLRQAGTLVELEELACEIGDEVSRQLMAGELAERCNEAADAASQCCPDCGQGSSRQRSHHRRLDSSRGELRYAEPAWHCPACRRDFFPGGRVDRASVAVHADAQGDPATGLGGQ